MANIKKGFQYFSIETDRYQDMKIKRLKKDCGPIGVAIYDYILCEIYRVEGSFIEWDESTVFDVADYWGLKESQVKEIVNYCCSVGLFSKELLASERVLTSGSIQKRFIAWSIKAKRVGYNIPEKLKVLEELNIIPEESIKLQEESTDNSVDLPQSKVKKSKEKKSKEGVPPPAVSMIYGSSVLRDIESLKAECLADRVNFVEHICRQNKIKPEFIQTALDDFNAWLRSIDVFMKSKTDYRTHFQGWFRKQDISQYGKQKGGMVL